MRVSVTVLSILVLSILLFHKTSCTAAPGTDAITVPSVVATILILNSVPSSAPVCTTELHDVVADPVRVISSQAKEATLMASEKVVLNCTIFVPKLGSD